MPGAMGNDTLRVIKRVPVPTGSPEFEQKRGAIINEFNKKVPAEYRIASHYIDNPPQDVTGIPRECGILGDLDLEITERHDVTSLAAAIAAKKYSAVQVATAFIKRSIVAHQISCCLTQWFPETALHRAEQLDQHLAKTGKTVGPLHGVPVSIKQHLPLAGTWSDLGFLATRSFDEKDAVLVGILRKLGAVFYCKTNQPQGIMHMESDSYLGRTLNPYNINLTSGGSSGGESALVALRGSIMGVGTDIGGSIRGPSGFVGIYGFKPTADTLPQRDMLTGGSSAELNVLASVGPMCHSLRDVDLFMREILAQKPYIQDPRVIPIPWTGLHAETGITASRPLKIGIMADNDFIKPLPPVLRALQHAQTRLEQTTSNSFIQIRPFTPLNTSQCWTSILPMFYPDGAEAVHSLLQFSGEPAHPLTPAPNTIPPANDSTGINNLRVLRDSFRSEASLDWERQDVDVVLCPMYPGPAPVHDTGAHWIYTAYWNFLDCPAMVFPSGLRVGKKGEEMEKGGDVGRPRNEDEKRVQELWVQNDYEGAPIALQLVARRCHDNFLVRAMDLVKQALGLEQ